MTSRVYRAARTRPPWDREIRGEQLMGLHRPARRVGNRPVSGVAWRNSYDDAPRRAVNAAYNELINRGKPRQCTDDFELSTAEWVAWYNQERLHEALGYVPASRVRGRPHRHLTPSEPANPGTRNRVGTNPEKFRIRAGRNTSGRSLHNATLL
jgi:hypothetical protein